MKIKKWDIWLADLSPQRVARATTNWAAARWPTKSVRKKHDFTGLQYRGKELGKTRPVVIVQTDLLNSIHPSTIICPLTTDIQKNVDILRVHLKRSKGSLKKDSDILVDQIRAIDNRRLIKKLGVISRKQRDILTANLSIVLDILV